MTDDGDDDDDVIDDDDGFSTSAWLLSGITGSLPGVLELADGRLAFTAGERCVFDVPLAQVRDVVFPWHYFGGGVKLNIGADSYRLSFVGPEDALSIGEGRRAGKAWKALLAAQMSS